MEIKTILFSIIVWIIIGLLSILIGTVTSILGLFDRSGDLPHLCGRIWGRLICKISRVKTEIIGLDNIYRDRAQIFLSNHQGFFDIFVLLAYLPIQFRWVAKESLFRIPFLGWGMRACRYIGVDRSDKKKALKSFLESVKRLKEGKSVIIFPEGTRAVEERIGELQKGGLLLAKRTGLPIVPITIKGSLNVMKRGSMKITPGKIRVILDKPIETEYLVKKDEDSLMEMIKEIFTRNF